MKKYCYSTYLFVLTALLIFLLGGTLHAQGLNHYCESEKVTGRAVYACEALSAVQSAAAQNPTLPIKSYSKLKKSCKLSCTNNSTCSAKDTKCQSNCSSKCEGSFISKNAKLFNTGIKNYDTACRVSLGGSACEKSEAKSFCDYNLLSNSKKYSKPKTFTEFLTLYRFYEKAAAAYTKRANVLTAEIKGYSEKMIKTVNDKLGCEHLPPSYNICTEQLAAHSRGDQLENYYLVVALRIEKSEKGVCQKGKGCVAQACTPDRDDDAYTTEADGSTCFCDEYCCEAGDCCGNFVSACSGTVSVSKCANSAMLMSIAPYSKDFSALRSTSHK